MWWEVDRSLDNPWEAWKSLAEKMRKLEASLQITNEEEQVSDDVAETQYKMEALTRQGQNSPETQKAYETFLAKSEQLTLRHFHSRLEYIDATKDLIADLWALTLNDGKKLKDVTIDGDWYDAMVCVYEGVKKAGEKILEELKQNFQTLVSPEEWTAILSALWEALKDPLQFFSTLLEGIKEYAIDVFAYIKTVMNSSTKTWFASEMSRFLPEEGIPFIITSIGPWKFLKMLKIERVFPEKLVETLERKKGKDADYEKDVVNILELNFDFSDAVSLEQARKNIGRFEECISLDYFTSSPEIANKIVHTLEEMSDYLVRNGEKIHANTEMKRDLTTDLMHIKRTLNTISDSSQDLPVPLIKRLQLLTRSDLPKAYYALNPSASPQA